jgi:hypothetical protein
VWGISGPPNTIRSRPADVRSIQEPLFPLYGFWSMLTIILVAVYRFFIVNTDQALATE